MGAVGRCPAVLRALIPGKRFNRRPLAPYFRCFLSLLGWAFLRPL